MKKQHLYKNQSMFEGIEVDNGCKDILSQCKIQSSQPIITVSFYEKLYDTTMHIVILDHNFRRESRGPHTSIIKENYLHNDGPFTFNCQSYLLTALLLATVIYYNRKHMLVSSFQAVLPYLKDFKYTHRIYYRLACNISGVKG